MALGHDKTYMIRCFFIRPVYEAYLISDVATILDYLGNTFDDNNEEICVVLKLFLTI